MTASYNPIQMRRTLHQIPEPGFEEWETQRTVLEVLAAWSSPRMEVQTWRTGVLVRIRGLKGHRTIGYRTDMDGLPIEEETGYAFKSRRPGFMHACGHDMHMTIALGIIRRLLDEPIDHHVVVLFQPAEEGPGGALPMMASDAFKAWRPDLILALHIAPEYPVGTIATRPGILFANTSELFVTFEGVGGHAAYPHKTNDMVVAAAHFVTQLQTIVSRNINPLDSAVVTIGKIEGGTRQNIIAQTARVEGTLRALSLSTMDRMKERIVQMVEGIEAGFDCRAKLDFGVSYRQVDNDRSLTEEFMAWLPQHTGVQLVHCSEAMTGEDFGYFLGEIPGFMFWLGVDTPFGLHHAKIEPHEGALDHGIDVVCKYIAWKSAQE
jgi:N-acetyldiaminopimelate deacetylase